MTSAKIINLNQIKNSKKIDMDILLNNFIEYNIKLNKSDNTIKTYKKEINTFLKQYNIYTTEQLSILNDIEFLKDTWLSDMINKYSSANVNKKKNILSVFSNYLVIEGIISENKIKFLSNVKNDIKKIEVYTEDELKTIFDYMDRKIKEDKFHRSIDKKVWMLNRLMVKITYDNALRISEIVGIKMEDIDLEKGNKFYIRGKGHNGNVSRFNVFKKETVELLKEYLNLRNEIEIKEGNEEYLFISPLSKSKITDNSLRKFFKNILDELNIDYNSPMHDIRHTKATELISKDVEVKKVSMYLGHTSERITEKYYIHQTDKVMEELSEL